MKARYKIILVSVMAMVVGGCSSDFLDRTPQGQLIDEQLNSTKGVEWLLTGAYGLMNGNRDGTWGNYGSAPSQWLFGDVAGGDAHKGSEAGDQGTMLEVEKHTAIPVNEHLATMYRNYYEGIIRCNTTLRQLKIVQETADEKFSDERAAQIEAEAKMLRGHYYFFLWRVFKNIPYIDENVSTADAAKVPNNTDVLPMIEADFQFATRNLPDTKPLGEVGRVDGIAAKAYLGKLYLYQGKFAEALALFKDVIAVRPDLESLNFLDNFDVNKENGPETIFSAQHAINPNGSGDNANVGDMLAGLQNSPTPMNCCGFFNPSFDLVNAFRVTTLGLPMLDGSYRNNPYKSDFGLTGSAKENYEVDKTLALDPRLDYTVGRRGVPYHDWGIFPGDAWLREPASHGPFVSYKRLLDKADFTGNLDNGGNVTALDVQIIRLADVYLMAAECAAETGDLEYALARVNNVRNRAAKLPTKKIGGTDAAAYNVKPYPAFATKEYALDAIRFERRLELALEGHRYFDLVRWGIAKDVLESYSAFEGGFSETFGRLYGGLNFGEKNTMFPIPQEQIDRSGGTLTQNTGY